MTGTARGDRRQNTTNYEHPQESHLLDLHYAMRYNNAGEPELRVNASGVTIAGNVDVDRVRIWDGTNNLLLEQPVNDSDPGTTWTVPTENHNMIFNGTTWDRMRGNIDNGVLTYLTNGTIAVTQSTSPWVVTGNANVTVTGNIAGITTLPAITGNVGVSGNVSITQMPGIRGNVTVDNYTGNVTVASFNPAYLTAFEEIMATPFFPEIQIDAVYGLPDSMEARQVGNATAGANVTTSLFYANSSTTSGSASFVASHNFMRYRPGQGAMSRFTAAYTMGNATAGIAGVAQRAGIFHIGEGYFFGFSGDTGAGNTGVGINHVYGGGPEVRTLTITTAPGGAQTATITLNSVPYTVSINTGTAANTAAQIAVGNAYGNVWQTQSVGNTVVFMSTSAGAKNGTYSFASSGTGTIAAGTVVQTTAGTTPTVDWVYQSAWNGASVSFDPSNLNVYAIDFRWLGAGIVRFFMEDPATGAMTLVHTQNWAGQHATPHCLNPSFRLGWLSTVVGSPACQQWSQERRV